MNPHPEVSSIAKLLDHAVLHPTHGRKETIAGCELGRKFSVGAVCIKPSYAAVARDALAGSGVAVCAVTGFPHGNSTVGAKVFETAEAIRNGATEIDVVINNGLVADEDWADVAAEVAAIQKACADGGSILKVIFEIDYLKPAQVETLCRICTDAGVAFVKTSTGFGYVKQPNGDFNYKGATEEMVRLMRASCGPQVGIKAAAGIRTLDDVIKFRDLGCTRIGVSATETILAEAVARFTGETVAAASTAEGY
ncbi:MAG: deoxyribose-phosphate aldolase [Terrimicrobiaceae bacterium]